MHQRAELRRIESADQITNGSKRLCTVEFPYDWVDYIGPTVGSNAHCFKLISGFQAGRFCVLYPEDVAIAPITWVADLPAYPGDILYHTSSDQPGTFVVGGRVRFGEVSGQLMVDGTDDYENVFLPVDNLSWDRPKKFVKKTGWLNKYSSGTYFVHQSKELADKSAGADRDGCFEIHWEEEE